MSTAGGRIVCVLMGDQSLLSHCGEILLERGHEITVVITRSATVASWARSHDLQVADDCARLTDEDAQPFDWLFSIANLCMIPAKVWQRARHGAVNFHDGPLPAYAGLNAPAWAIMAGETTHGVTWHALAEGADTGNIIVQRRFEIGPDETSIGLNTKCFEAGMESFSELLSRIESGNAQGSPQDLSARTHFAKAARPVDLATVDFNQDCATIGRLFRALDFGAGYDNPLTLPKLHANGRAYAIITAVVRPCRVNVPPGSVISADASSTAIAARDGIVEIRRLADAHGDAVAPGSILAAGSVLPPCRPAFAPALRRWPPTSLRRKSLSPDGLPRARMWI